MKYATFALNHESSPRLGVVTRERIVELRALAGPQWKGPLPSSMLELIDAGPPTWQRVADFATQSLAHQQNAEGSYALEEVRLLAPVPRPRKNIVCLGLNYMSHMEETAKARGREVKVPEVPVFFTKAPTTVSGPHD